MNNMKLSNLVNLKKEVRHPAPVQDHLDDLPLGRARAQEDRGRAQQDPGVQGGVPLVVLCHTFACCVAPRPSLVLYRQIVYISYSNHLIKHSLLDFHSFEFCAVSVNTS